MEYTITPLNPHRRRSGDGAIGMLLPERFRVRNAATDPQGRGVGLLRQHPARHHQIRPVQIGVQQLSVLRLTRRHCQEDGSSAATVMRPRGGAGKRAPKTSQAAVKFQKDWPLKRGTTNKTLHKDCTAASSGRMNKRCEQKIPNEATEGDRILTCQGAPRSPAFPRVPRDNITSAKAWRLGRPMAVYCRSRESARSASA
jgi:hypothetical protein